MRVGEFREIVIVACLRYGGSETSGVRTTARNKLVGGVAKSRHLNGYAVDVVLDDPQLAADFTAEMKRHGLRVVDERKKDGHLHVQWP